MIFSWDPESDPVLCELKRCYEAGMFDKFGVFTVDEVLTEARRLLLESDQGLCGVCGQRSLFHICLSCHRVSEK